MRERIERVFYHSIEKCQEGDIMTTSMPINRDLISKMIGDTSQLTHFRIVRLKILVEGDLGEEMVK